MEAGGGDGGSDVSYESVASEGGYEPASERGRDPLPRIISSSHCVEVFRRVRWTDGAFCCRAPSPDEDDCAGKAAAREPRAHDPLFGLPPRLLRFDGAMEAWLEEMPMPRDPHHIPRPYLSLNDAATRHTPPRADLSILRAGNRRATIWYFTLEFLQQLWPSFLQPDGSGIKVWERALLERSYTIQQTHVEVGQVQCNTGKGGKARVQWLKSLFAAMQASKWTPDGEARTFLIKRRLSHASMSIGDAVQIGGELFVAGLAGFVAIKEGDRLLPPNYEPENEEPESGEGAKPRPAKVEKAAGKKEKEKEEEKKAGGTGRKSGKGGRGKGKGEDGEAGTKKGGKGRGKGKGGGEDAREKGKKDGRAKEPGPADRIDRRKLRAQLQAKREELQGGH